MLEDPGTSEKTMYKKMFISSQYYFTWKNRRCVIEKTEKCVESEELILFLFVFFINVYVINIYIEFDTIFDGIPSFVNKISRNGRK